MRQLRSIVLEILLDLLLIDDDGFELGVRALRGVYALDGLEETAGVLGGALLADAGAGPVALNDC